MSTDSTPWLLDQDTVTKEEADIVGVGEAKEEFFEQTLVSS